MATQKRTLRGKNINMDISSLEAPSEPFRASILSHFDSLAQLDNWASARDVQTLSKSIFNKAIQNTETIKGGELPITAELIESECLAMITERKSRGDTKLRPASLFGNLIPEPQPRQFESPTTTTRITLARHHIVTELDTPEKEEVTPGPIELKLADKPIYPTPKCDARVSDAVWEQLQRDQEAEIRQEEEYRALLQEKDKAANAERDKIMKKLLEEEERRKREAEMKAKLAVMGRCSMGFEWIKQNGGYRCGGGSHLVSDNELK